MNFRNISSWCIRNPVAADRPVRRPDARRPHRLHADGREQRPGHRFPGGDRHRRPAGRGADRDGNADHPARRSPRSAASTASRRSTARSAKATARPSSSSRSAPDRPRRQRRPQRDRPDPRQPARRHPRAAGRPASTPRTSRSSYVGAADHRHDARAAELVHRQYRRQAAARRRGHRRGRPRSAASTARSGSILDPVALQAQGITAAQVNQQLRQININAAGGRAEIAGSEQSVRVLGNARDAYELSQTQIALAGGRIGPAGRPRRGQGQLFRAALDRQDERPPGRQLHRSSAPRARPTSPSTTRPGRSCDKLEKENPEGPVHRALQHRRLHQGAVHIGDGRPDRGRGPRRPRRLPVPARHPRDADLGARHPAVGDPGLLVHGACWGSRSTSCRLLALGLVAGVLVDDAIVEIENIVRHMRMGKSAYQASIDAADEIGLAVLATTMAIVAVFLPVALMPGISGQFFKAFGFTVVVVGADEPARRAHDHAADRGLFPALARASSRTPTGKWMDRLSEGAQLEPRHVQGRCDAGEAAEARSQLRLLRRSATRPAAGRHRRLRRRHRRRA